MAYRFINISCFIIVLCVNVIPCDDGKSGNVIPCDDGKSGNVIRCDDGKSGNVIRCDDGMSGNFFILVKKTVYLMTF